MSEKREYTNTEKEIIRQLTPFLKVSRYPLANIEIPGTTFSNVVIVKMVMAESGEIFLIAKSTQAINTEFKYNIPLKLVTSVDLQQTIYYERNGVYSIATKTPKS